MNQDILHALPQAKEVYGVKLGGKRPRWYPINEVNRDAGEVYGVSVPDGGIDGACLILLESIIEVR